MVINENAPNSGLPDDENPTSFSDGHHLMDKYIKHSCYPNVLSILTNGQNVMVTARPIKKGEQVLDSRVKIRTEPASARQKELLNVLGKNCDCSRCRGVTASAAQRQQLSSEPAYQSGSFAKWLVAKFFCDTNDGYKEIISDCVPLLQTYGHLEWCKEIQTVLENYLAALFVRVTGSTQ